MLGERLDSGQGVDHLIEDTICPPTHLPPRFEIDWSDSKRHRNTYWRTKSHNNILIFSNTYLLECASYVSNTKVQGSGKHSMYVYLYMYCIFCIISGHLPKYPEILQPIMSLLQKLSGFAKTFRSALLTRWQGFSDSAHNTWSAEFQMGFNWTTLDQPSTTSPIQHSYDPFSSDLSSYATFL